jgi:multiple antibiotic resistance protein
VLKDVQVFVGAPGHAFFTTSEIFVVFFVTMGPINFLRLFVALTTDTDPAFGRRLAARAAAIASVALLLSGYVGAFLLNKWHLSIGAIAISGAVMLFVVAMKSIWELYERPPVPTGQSPQATLALAASPLAFPNIVTPYGVATLIVFLTLAQGQAATILALALLVMAIDFVVMLFAQPITRVFSLPLRLLGVLLCVLQIAMSIQFVLFAIRTIGAQGV